MAHPPTNQQHPPDPKTEQIRAWGAAQRLLALRARSVEEMRQRLGQRYSRPVVEQTIARLLDASLLNDADFAAQWRQSRERRKPRSRGAIERELKQRGVDHEIVEQAFDGYDSLAAAHRAAAPYAARQVRNDCATFDRRISAFLGRRGFEPDVIRQTLGRLREELAVTSHPRAYLARD